jgi:hypothetical protein
MPVAPAEYALIFEDHKIGAAILEELIARFGGNPYVPGALEAQRETDYRAGRKAVVDFIVLRINQAAGHEAVTDLEPTKEN